MIVRIPNPADQEHLAEVIDDMRTLGAPIVHAVDCGEYYVALEGSHRVTAARSLGLVPTIVAIDYEDTRRVADIVGDQWEDDDTVSEAVDSMLGLYLPVVDFSDLCN